MTLDAQRQEQVRVLLREIVVSARQLVASMDAGITPLVGVMAHVRALQTNTERLRNLGITVDDQIDLAVDELAGIIRLIDLTTFRVPNSPEGLS